MISFSKGFSSFDVMKKGMLNGNVRKQAVTYTHLGILFP